MNYKIRLNVKIVTLQIRNIVCNGYCFVFNDSVNEYLLISNLKKLLN